MIIYLIIAFTITTILSWLLISNKPLRLTLGIMSIVLLVGSIGALSLNMKNHYGMEKKSVVTTSKEIYTAGSAESPANMLLAKELGTDSKNYVMIYRDSEHDKKPEAHFVPNKKQIVDASKKRANYRLVNDKDASVREKSTYWVYKNDTMKWLFKMDDTERILIKKQITVNVPKDTWVVLTPEQAQQLAAKQKSVSPQAASQQQEALKQQLAGQVAKYKQENPEASAKQLADYTQYLTAKAATQQIKQMLK